MPIDNPQYDVAISFLSEDQTTAAAIYGKLSEGLKVFFYPRNQEELAGTDGLESMRKPFFDSRVMVVLYREKWGKTPWTRVEETAIKEACFKSGWERLFFISLDQSDILPGWLPPYLVRFYADFGLEQAVGAIKARVQDQGGKNVPLTAMKSAEIYQANEAFRRDKRSMNSEKGMKAILETVAELLQHIQQKCADINTQGYLQIKCGTDFNERQVNQLCVMTNGQVGLKVTWHQPYANTLDKGVLLIHEFATALILPAETQLTYYDQPRQIGEAKYLPDLSLTRDYGWRQDADESEFVSSTTLAEQIVMLFVDLANRKASGKTKR
jgi:TIR domain-containing protein